MTKFVDFWDNLYPHPANRGSKSETEALYDKLTKTEQREVHDAIPGYKDYLAEYTWNPAMQARRFLHKKKRNWETWLIDAETTIPSADDLDIEEIRARNRRQDEYAEQQWRDRYEKQFGRRPE